MRRTKSSLTGFRPGMAKPGSNKVGNTSYGAQAPGNNTMGNRRTWKTLTNKEIEEKRSKGLCYYCDERYGPGPGHKCSKKLYRMDLCMEETGETKEGEEDEEEEEEEIAAEVPLKYKIHQIRASKKAESEIKLKAITGEPMYDTINVTDDVGEGQKILMLVNSGSTHNFLDEQVVEQIGYEIEEGAEFKVSVADGQTVKSNKRCKCLTWSMEGEYFQDEFLIIPLTDYDAILGIQWLQPLKQVTWDFEAKSLNFSFNGKELQISATPTPSIEWADGEKMAKTIRKTKVERRTKCLLMLGRAVSKDFIEGGR